LKSESATKTEEEGCYGPPNKTLEKTTFQRKILKDTFQVLTLGDLERDVLLGRYIQVPASWCLPGDGCLLSPFLPACVSKVIIYISELHCYSTIISLRWTKVKIQVSILIVFLILIANTSQPVLLPSQTGSHQILFAVHT